MNSNQNIAADLAKVNQEEMTLLQGRLQREEEKADSLGRQFNSETQRQHKLASTFDELVQEKMSLQKRVRDEKFLADKMAETLENKKQTEQDNTSGIRGQ